MKKVFVTTLLGLTLCIAQPILLKTCSFDPAYSSPVISDNLRLVPDPTDNYYIVQCTGPILQEWKDKITQLGCTIYEYIPEYAFTVRINVDKVEEIQKLAFVQWIGYYHPLYKISPCIGEMQYTDPVRANDPWLNLRVCLFYDADIHSVIHDLKGVGANIITVARHDEYRIKRVDVDIAPENLTKLAHIQAVKWIEEIPEYVLHNNTTRWVMQTNTTNDTTIWSHGIRGDGQLLSVMDSGIDYLSCFFRDPEGDPFGNNHRKIQAHYLYGSAQAYDDHGHGTHTSGTACGNDYTNTYAQYNGMAKNARMIMQDIGYGGGNLSTPNPLTIGFQDAMDDGAFAQTNSWGYTSGNSYTIDSQDVDDFMYNNKYFIILFSAGNSGPSVNSVHPPATAKNDITVGASRQAPSQDYIANSSSRGPADDSRLEPTVAISGWDANDNCPDPWNPGPNAIYSALNSGTTPTPTCEWVADDWCGTSMSAPAACGATALIRQYYMDGFYPTGIAEPGNAFTPTNNLIRATLINSAADMGTANIPNNDEGWGRILLDNALYFTGDTRDLRIVEHDGINTNDTVTYTYTVDNGSEPLEIVCAWSDIGGAVSANPALVNDLDLVVISPTADVYYGNVYSGGQSQTGGMWDRYNTVECVQRNTPETGIWTVRVAGHNVPSGPQHFALCLTGAFAPIGIVEEHAYDVTEPSFAVRSPGKHAEITFTLTKEQHVNISVYDVTGRKVATVANGKLSPHDHSVVWDARSVSAGIYFLIIASDEINSTSKFILVK